MRGLRDEGIKYAVRTGMGPGLAERHLFIIGLRTEREELADEKEFEAFLEQFEGSEAEPPDDLSIEEQAQLVAYDAFKEEGEARTELAERALEMDADCIDGVLALWEMEEPETQAALELAERAYEMAGRRLTQVPEDWPGDDLWQCGVAFRPAVRAHGALALTLWARGQRARAQKAAEDAIALNPGDNPGLRWWLVNWYLVEGASRKALRLLRAYPDEPVAPAQYAAALTEYARSGASKKAQRRLRRATEHNASVLSFLIGEGTAGADLPSPSFFCVGDVNETVLWRGVIREAWEATPGAMDWARQCGRQAWFGRQMIEHMVAQLAELAAATGEDPAEAMADLLKDMGEDLIYLDDGDAR